METVILPIELLPFFGDNLTIPFNKKNLISMKYNQSPPSFKTRVISTDGSSISIEFPYPKKELFLMNDLKNIPLYLSQKKKRL